MASLRLSDNMFEGLNINQELLTKKLPEFDIMSTITSKSTKGLQLKKKDKKKLRHDVWLNSECELFLFYMCMNYLQGSNQSFKSLKVHEFQVN